jgi:hypothetical protein
MVGALTDAAELLNFANIDAFSDQSAINGIKKATAVLQNPLSTLAERAAALSATGRLGMSQGATLSNMSGVGSDGLFSDVPASLKKVSSAIDEMTKDVGSFFSSNTGKDSILGRITFALSSIRTNLFAPVYGVMNSLTKLVGAVFGGGGISSILNKLTAPIRGILGDITRIANQATAIAHMVTTGISNIGRNARSGFGLTQSYQDAVKAVTKTAGTIANLPHSIGDSILGLTNSAHLPATASFLKSNPKATLSRTPTALKASGSAAHSNLSPQLAILSRGAKTPKGAYI